jgi:hypothetical protein
MRLTRDEERALRAANAVFADTRTSARVAAVVFAIAFGIIVLVAAGACFAEEQPAESPRRATLTYAGASGVWFRADVAREMLSDLEELPLLRERVGLMGERLQLRDDQVERLHRIVSLSEEAEARAVAALAAADRGRQAAEDRASAWWRHPALWTVVGFVAAAALVALTAYALSAVPEW